MFAFRISCQKSLSPTECSIDVYTLPRVKQLASVKLLYSTKSLAQCSVMTLSGGVVGEGGSRGRGHMYI